MRQKHTQRLKILNHQGVSMLEIQNLSSYTLDSHKFEEIFFTLTKAYKPNLASHLCVEILITDSAQIQEINTTHRNQDKPTDVLSFPLDVDFVYAPAECMLNIGSVVLNAQMADAIATNLGHSLEDELYLLFIHALLHIFGFDHEVDNGEHRQEECQWITFFKLPKSLIERTQDS